VRTVPERCAACCFNPEEDPKPARDRVRILRLAHLPP
jgi:hypothetical protein